MELKTIKPTIEVYNSTLATILSYQKDILLSTYSIGAPLSDFKEGIYLICDFFNSNMA